MLRQMDFAFKEFEQCVPSPKTETLAEGVIFKFENQGIKEAII